MKRIKKTSLTINGVQIEVNLEIAQMLELWNSDFKSYVPVFQYVKEPWGQGGQHT